MRRPGPIRNRTTIAGFGLIELMVAMTIALILSAATLTLYLNMSRSNSELAKTSSQMEHGRLAIRLLRDDLMHAGFLDGYVPTFDDLTAASTADREKLRTIPSPADFPKSVPAPCARYEEWDEEGDDQGKTDRIGLPVQLYGSIPSGCTELLTHASEGNDVLLVRHVDTCVMGSTNCEPGTLYWQTSRCNAASTPRYVLSDKEAELVLRKRNCLELADKRRFLNNIYYIRSYASEEGDGIPTLMRSHFAGLAQQPAVAMVEGIEAMRFVFGVDNLSDTGEAVNYDDALLWASALNRNSPTNRGDGSPDSTCTSATPCSVEDLTNTVVVQVHLLVRNIEPTPGYQSGKTYNLGGQTFGPFTDAFQRHVYSTTVRLTNVSARRETP
jgi:type IV pilus assembly protein PilW